MEDGAWTLPPFPSIRFRAPGGGAHRAANAAQGSFLLRVTHIPGADDGHQPRAYPRLRRFSRVSSDVGG